MSIPLALLFTKEQTHGRKIAIVKELHRCLDHVTKLTRTKNGGTREERRHHIATDHGPCDTVRKITLSPLFGYPKWMVEM